MNFRLIITLSLALVCTASFAKKKKEVQQLFPDGTPIPAWFSDTAKVDVDKLGKRYVVTEVKNDSNLLQTEQIQAVIDRAATDGGGVVVIPQGTFLSGSIFFKQGTHLYLEKGGRLKGSDRIRNFRLQTTRMEGQTLKYFSALVNADGIDGFTIAGHGTIDGNGRNYWEEF